MKIREHQLTVDKSDKNEMYCTMCECTEIFLTRECPSRKLTAKEKDLVEVDRLDFINGRWIRKW